MTISRVTTAKQLELEGYKPLNKPSSNGIFYGKKISCKERFLMALKALFFTLFPCSKAHFSNENMSLKGRWQMAFFGKKVVKISPDVTCELKSAPIATPRPSGSKLRPQLGPKEAYKIQKCNSLEQLKEQIEKIPPSSLFVSVPDCDRPIHKEFLKTAICIPGMSLDLLFETHEISDRDDARVILLSGFEKAVMAQLSEPFKKLFDTQYREGSTKIISIESLKIFEIFLRCLFELDQLENYAEDSFNLFTKANFWDLKPIKEKLSDFLFENLKFDSEDELEYAVELGVFCSEIAPEFNQRYGKALGSFLSENCHDFETFKKTILWLKETEFGKTCPLDIPWCDYFTDAHLALLEGLCIAKLRLCNYPVKTDHFENAVETFKENPLIKVSEIEISWSSHMIETHLNLLKNLPITKLCLKNFSDSHLNEVTDDQLSCLQHLKKLQTLELRSLKFFRGSALEYLKDLENLEVVSLESCYRISELKHIQHLKKLKTLNLSFCKLPEEGLTFLDSLNHLENLNLDDCKNLQNGMLKHLENLPYLQELSMVACHSITDEGLEYLKALKNLRKLTLTGCRVTEAGLTHLLDLENLEELTFYPMHGDHAIKDKGLKVFHSFKNLRKLSIRHWAGITEEGLLSLPSQLEDLDISHTHCILKNLNSFKNLKKFSLNGVKVMDPFPSYLLSLPLIQLTFSGNWAPFSGLQNLDKLETLDFTQPLITDDELTRLSSLKNLKKLNISECYKITDKGLKELRSLENLEELDLSSYHITNEVLEHLSHLKELKILRLNDYNPLTNGGISHLRHLEKLKTLEWHKVSASYFFTTEDLAAIGRLSHLEALSLSFCEIFTDTGIQHLLSLKKLRALHLFAYNYAEAQKISHLFQHLPNLHLSYRHF